MNYRKYALLTAFAIGVFMFGCNNDDDNNTPDIQIEDRGEQAKKDDSLLVDYLKKHFYNYEEFNNPPSDFDYQIVIDTIDEANKDKIPLFDQVVTKKVTLLDVEQNLYTLQVRKGERGVSGVADSTFVTYQGQLLNGEIFDSAVSPIWFDLPGIIQNGGLTGVIEGFRQGLAGYGGATTVGVDPVDGTITYSNDFGIGAVFMPSGLGYFNSARTGIPAYSPLVFTFSLFQINDTDHDNDHIPSILEDLNNNMDLYDDDTDGDGLFDYLDSDDDGDGTRTVDEDLEPDTDLSVDRDGDGDPTNDIGDGDPTNDDTDGDGVPNYLDSDDFASRTDT